MYYNLEESDRDDGKVEVTWSATGLTSKVSLLQNEDALDTKDYAEDGTTPVKNSHQGFNSYHASRTYGGDTRYSGLQFHFHHQSEHTVDGEHMDLEMHTVHYPNEAKNGVIASAMGLMFDTDTNKQTRKFEDWEVGTIDAFFTSLSWDSCKSSSDCSDSVIVEKVSYGDLMMMVDTNNRWTYRGSVTTPPCAQNVYWNVLQTIYPIKPAHLKQFKFLMRK